MRCKKKELFICKIIIAIFAIFFYYPCFAASLDDYEFDSPATSESTTLSKEKANFESVENLKNVTKDFVKKNISLDENDKMEIQVSQADLPTKLPLCTKPIDAAFPKGTSKERITAIELTCNGDNPWHTYVPVNVDIYAKVIVAKKPIVPNQIITEEDLDYASYDTKHLYSGYYREKEKDVLIGQTTSHPIEAGAVLNKRNIHTVALIHRNQEITLVARSNTVEVTMMGIAKSDGGLNETIEAYNPSSKKTLSAIVIGTDKAEVLG